MPCAATLNFDTAQAILAAHARPLGPESVTLDKMAGRTLTEPVYAAIDIPRCDAAAMDGYAVRESDLAAGMRHFAVVGAAYPGAPWHGDVGAGEAVRIMTGSSMPTGAGRVLIRECMADVDDTVTLEGDVPAKRHVRRQGSDAVAGMKMLSAGRLLDPRALVVAAAANAATLTVWRRPRVRVIATGDELVQHGLAGSDSGVPDSLSDAVQLMARQWGAVPLGSSIARDRIEDVAAAAATALVDADVLVVVGGASRGDRDVARRALMSLGLDMCFADIAMKPGKPAWFGRIGARHVLGLPGNPTAAMTVARLFLAPLLTALGGRGTAAALRWDTAPLAGTPGASGDREAFSARSGWRRRRAAWSGWSPSPAGRAAGRPIRDRAR